MHVFNHNCARLFLSDSRVLIPLIVPVTKEIRFAYARKKAQRISHG
jgi:hypothetical protein